MSGFTFNSESFENVQRKWMDVRAGLEQDQREAAKLAVLAPGHEPASGFVAKTQDNANEALRTSIGGMLAFVNSYLHNLDAAKRQYQAQEDVNDANFRNGR